MMPIIIKDFEWSENAEWVFITLDMKGVKTGSIDIVSSPTYLKIHWSPFIFEVFLKHKVDDDLGECTFDKSCGKVSLRLKKGECGVSWGQLENKELTKEEKSAKRAAAIEISHQRHEQEKKARQKRQFNRKQASVQDQIRLDSEAKERITQIKNFESQKAVNELNEWASTADLNPNNGCSFVEELSVEEVDHNSRSIISAFAHQHSAANDSGGGRFTECSSPADQNPARDELTPSTKGTFETDAAPEEPSVEKDRRQNNNRIWTEDEVNELPVGVERSQQHYSHQHHQGEPNERSLSNGTSDGNPAISLSAERMSSPMERKEESESGRNICSTGLGPQVAEKSLGLPSRLRDQEHSPRDESRGTPVENRAETEKCDAKNRHSDRRTVQVAKPSSKIENEVIHIRPTVCISVNFTPREFPTPCRESLMVEEQEWLKKQAEARRLSGFVDEDLRPEERNPQWLLDKGLSLMRAESYLGAISAFSLGIRLAPKMPELYVERAGAHLAVKNYHRTVEDCSQALELLTPKVKANEGDRLKCHIRRGDAFRNLEMWEDALTDYKEAIRLKPMSEELISVRDEIQMVLERENKEKVK
ncbi:hypothetical protein Ocin01_09280 [Orchesella cincta]|uniref:CS domain-containing protein n=1 Tax=Orchesella cincta TaxID=48709 RepID=A0A1D2MWG4_ORCCI|nr:hypothetical protein Ocin01_09280 [Orchesella cincta]